MSHVAALGWAPPGPNGVCPTSRPGSRGALPDDPCPGKVTLDPSVLFITRGLWDVLCLVPHLGSIYHGWHCQAHKAPSNLACRIIGTHKTFILCSCLCALILKWLKLPETNFLCVSLQTWPINMIQILMNHKLMWKTSFVYFNLFNTLNTWTFKDLQLHKILPNKYCVNI